MDKTCEKKKKFNNNDKKKTKVFSIYVQDFFWFPSCQIELDQMEEDVLYRDAYLTFVY